MTRAKMDRTHATNQLLCPLLKKDFLIRKKQISNQDYDKSDSNNFRVHDFYHNFKVMTFIMKISVKWLLYSDMAPDSNQT